MSSNSLGGWGYAVEVLWWGQSDKQQHQDIDELLIAGRWNEVRAIAPDEFFQLHPVSTRAILFPIKPFPRKNADFKTFRTLQRDNGIRQLSD